MNRESESLGLDDFPTGKQLTWHGHTPGVPDWSATSRFVAFSMVSTLFYCDYGLYIDTMPLGFDEAMQCEPSLLLFYTWADISFQDPVIRFTSKVEELITIDNTNIISFDAAF